jgi:hypothetical protein
MRNISTTVRGHYDNDRYRWAIIIGGSVTAGIGARFTGVIVVLLYKTSN